jgi:type III secretory pathway lipoprotein EscJ
VVVVLQSQNISATKVATAAQAGQAASYSITVSGSDANDALKILVDNKIPKTQSAGYAGVYAGGSGIIPSSTQEKAQYLMALQGEIENMLLVLPGIVQASVVLVLPDPTLIRDPSAPAPQSSASVAVVYNPSDRQGNAQVSAYDIQYLVASAVPDLPAKNITVLMASNSPLKLIDGNKAVSTAVSTTPATTPTPTATPPAAGATKTPSASTVPPASNKNDFLLTLFGVLAGIGLLFGLLGLLRSISLKAKLARLQSAAGNASAPAPQGIGGETTIAAE